MKNRKRPQRRKIYKPGSTKATRREAAEHRRSNAAGIHGDTKYNRKDKYPANWSRDD